MNPDKLLEYLKPIPDPSSIGIIQTDSVKQLTLKEYIEMSRDFPRFSKMCEECPRYGKAWACPPFDYDCTEALKRYSDILLVATRIEPLEHGMPESKARDVLRPARARVEKGLLKYEKNQGGFAFGFAGGCLCCDEGTCTRLVNLPCRHPELARPSLESFGFDITKTLSEVFGWGIEWCTDGRLPRYLTLVSGVIGL